MPPRSNNCAALENPRAAAAAQPLARARCHASVANVLAVERAERLGDLRLQAGQVSADSLYVVESSRSSLCIAARKTDSGAFV